MKKTMVIVLASIYSLGVLPIKWVVKEAKIVAEENQEIIYTTIEVPVTEII